MSSKLRSRASAKKVAKPRNPVARSPLLRKGGVHQKTGGALRKGAKDRLRKALRAPEDD